MITRFVLALAVLTLIALMILAITNNPNGYDVLGYLMLTAFALIGMVVKK
jgi:hypothetical protein